MNYLAIFVCAILSFVIGMFWYSPVLFGDAWRKHVGLTSKDFKKAKKGLMKSMIIGFSSGLIMMFVLSYFIDMFVTTSFAAGSIIGIITWAGFLATSMTGIVSWENKPWELYFINTGYYLVVLAVTGGILAV
ncbi:DUF1761 domain-containing protein [archaeon]|nr:DUF1761 domain-containing protein [archaeon]MBT4021787.1 DUF1761 domain-containing protein [archaeon]MBT4271798.1 DUF1761 domain-containing protein [archaeon]MBT4460507.1 DUF1761 domain-containing protein [archaeon]MBT4858527.1 DUF1761 domain-containing protein [archaeon]